MNELYAVYACDTHRSRDTMRLLTVVDITDSSDVEQLGKLIQEAANDTQLNDMDAIGIIHKAINQEIDFLLIEEVTPLKDHNKNSFEF